VGQIKQSCRKAALPVRRLFALPPLFTPFDAPEKAVIWKGGSAMISHRSEKIATEFDSLFPQTIHRHSNIAVVLTGQISLISRSLSDQCGCNIY
jgi:hypothetical protein